ncbi:hypothetical protein BGZ60DRAFT_534424 [Tricladium varicosporioides]|nr:hypothetical protein BGZ60DRAFT_534424 [Hymenoscyphus varicosporioides]
MESSGFSPCKSQSQQSPGTLCPASPSKESKPSENKVLQWEERALERLRVSGSHGTWQLLTLVPFKDQKALQDVLSARWDSTLDFLLSSLHKEKGGRWASYDKAGELLRLIIPRPVCRPIWNRSWTPPNVALGDSSAIADEVHEVVSSAFYNVPFLDWIRMALGLEAHSITELFDGVFSARQALHQRYHELHQPREKYKDVENKLRPRSRLAHWIFASALGLTSDPPKAACESILRPIQDCFAGVGQNFKVEQLAILGRRYQHMHDKEDVDWNRLGMDFSFLEQITSTAPEKLAVLITDAECTYFSQLRAQDFFKNPKQVASIYEARWSERSNEIDEYTTAIPDLGKSIFEVAKHLWGMRNYSSVTAILQGLKNAKVCPEPHSILWTSIDSTGNYRAYRKQWSRRPGLPYLRPHIRRRIPAGVVRDIFYFTAYYAWREEPEWQRLLYLCRTLRYLVFGISLLAWSLLLVRFRPQNGWSRRFLNRVPPEDGSQCPEALANSPKPDFSRTLHPISRGEDPLKQTGLGENLASYSEARASRQDSLAAPVLSPARTLVKYSWWDSSTTLYAEITPESTFPRDDFSGLSNIEKCLNDSDTRSLRPNRSIAPSLCPLNHHSRSPIGTVEAIDKVEQAGKAEGHIDSPDSAAILSLPAAIPITESRLQVLRAEVISNTPNRSPEKLRVYRKPRFRLRPEYCCACKRLCYFTHRSACGCKHDRCKQCIRGHMRAMEKNRTELGLTNGITPSTKHFAAQALQELLMYASTESLEADSIIDQLYPEEVQLLWCIRQRFSEPWSFKTAIEKACIERKDLMAVCTAYGKGFTVENIRVLWDCIIEDVGKILGQGYTFGPFPLYLKEEPTDRENIHIVSGFVIPSTPSKD